MARFAKSDKKEPSSGIHDVGYYMWMGIYYVQAGWMIVYYAGVNNVPFNRLSQPDTRSCSGQENRCHVHRGEHRWDSLHSTRCGPGLTITVTDTVTPGCSTSINPPQVPWPTANGSKANNMVSARVLLNPKPKPSPKPEPLQL